MERFESKVETFYPTSTMVGAGQQDSSTSSTTLHHVPLEYRVTHTVVVEGIRVEDPENTK